MIIVAASPRPTALLHDTKVKNRRTAAKEKTKSKSKASRSSDLTSHSIPAGGAERSEHPRKGNAQGIVPRSGTSAAFCAGEGVTRTGLKCDCIHLETNRQGLFHTRTLPPEAPSHRGS